MQEKTVTTSDLIDDLRSRINPAYANQLGTDSYERRLCAEALEAQAEEIERLRETLQCIADADWRKWEEFASPHEFVSWSKSRARSVL